MRERRERFSIGGETGRRAAGCHHVVATGSKPTPNKAAWCLLIDKKTVKQRTEATGHITHHRRAPQVECDVHGPRARSIEQYGKYYWVPDGWNQPDRMVHPTRLVPQGVKTNTKNCLQALFVFDWVQDYYQRVSGRRESGRRHSS